MHIRSCLLPPILALVTACSGMPTPVSPGPLDTAVPEAPTPPPPRPPVVPGVRAPAGTYEFLDTATRVAFYTRHSRFVLGDDGTFAMEYEGLAVYRGTYSYSPANGIISFAWEGWSAAGPWEATGILREDVLTVTYNIVMMLTDFEDATYKRLPNP